MNSFPSNAIEFQEAFGTEEQCEEYLVKLRWPRGFVCPNCGHDDSYVVSTRKLYQCTVCLKQTSVTAGTLFHGTHLPLKCWFWIIYQVAQDKGGASCRKLASQLNRPVKTVWHVLHKVRYAMGRRDEGISLAGFIEIDEAILGPEARRPAQEGEAKEVASLEKKSRIPRLLKLGRKPKKGKKRKTQVEVIVLVEAERFHAGNVVLRAVERTTYEAIKETVELRVDPGQMFKGDKKQAHFAVRSLGHKFIAKKSDPETACSDLPIVHRVISLLKHFLMGTYYGVSKKYLPGYLNEFCFRFIRREKEQSLSESLLRACVFALPMTYSELK